MAFQIQLKDDAIEFKDVKSIDASGSNTVVLQASIAISMKRIADILELMLEKYNAS